MRRRKLLLVEDDDSMRELIKLTLEPLRLNLYEAGTIHDAWTMLEKQHPDTVLVDVSLERLRDGLELCRQIKQAPELGDIRVIVISTASQLEDIERGQAAGADLYIVKPFSPAHLLAIISTHRA
jgi:CheY-like chemotaxis protein